MSRLAWAGMRRVQHVVHARAHRPGGGRGRAQGQNTVRAPRALTRKPRAAHAQIDDYVKVQGPG